MSSSMGVLYFNIFVSCPTLMEGYPIRLFFEIELLEYAFIVFYIRENVAVIFVISRVGLGSILRSGQCCCGKDPTLHSGPSLENRFGKKGGI
jgi:hypothetical protein